MRLQLLISTMNQTDSSLLEKMNICSEALIINQCDRLELKEFIYNGFQIEWYSFPEIGVGKSRNNALIRATGDILVFADDDVTYKTDYVNIIISEFQRHPKADIIIFNVPSINLDRTEYLIRKFHRIHFFNCLRYGTFRIAVRGKSLRKKQIYFSQLFGGGSLYGSGEDSIFLMECIRKGLRMYASPQTIGVVSHEESSWFSGYTDKYFYDKGALFANMSERFSYILSLQFCLRHRELFPDVSIVKAYQLMQKGIDDYRNGS